MIRLRVREVAEQKGIADAAKLSREANIAYDTARRLWSGDPGSHGDKGPGLLTLWRVARALGVSVEDLFEESNEDDKTKRHSPMLIAA